MECKACGYKYEDKDLYKNIGKEEFIMINEPVTIEKDEYGNPIIERQLYICPKCGTVKVDLKG